MEFKGLTVIVLLLLLVLSVGLASASENEKVVDITIDNQKQLFLDHTGIVGTWFAVFEGNKGCKECRRIAPEIIKLA